MLSTPNVGILACRLNAHSLRTDEVLYKWTLPVEVVAAVLVRMMAARTEPYRLLLLTYHEDAIIVAHEEWVLPVAQGGQPPQGTPGRLNFWYRFTPTSQPDFDFEVLLAMVRRYTNPLGGLAIDQISPSANWRSSD